MKTLFKSQDLWDLIENGYIEPDEEQIQRQKLGGSCRQHFKDPLRVAEIVNKMQSYRENINDQMIVAKILRSFTPKFDYVVATIEESKDVETFTFDELMGSMQSHEARLNRSQENTYAKAFHVKGEQVIKNIWFLDSGCSNHMISVKSLFNEIDETFKQKVTLGDNKQIQVEGKANVAVKSSSSNVKLLYDVYYIPSLSQNLLSVRQLMAIGYFIMFDDIPYVIKDKKSD
ncbi:uncharacterized protein LOC128295429 [Gossypium arboreum]|uniref:uncharacterized protein LOC128295429 n=1 Tax=Gossypium arboreum TaxID=29729 RepID=UPI0022F1B634|nr:uncharacterized protein LOC128295429 [Gossypium arboreum]